MQLSSRERWLPPRTGDPPETTRADPHRQLTQNAPPELQDELVARAATLPLTVVCPSIISLPGARAFALDVASPASTKGFIIAREFAHIHPPDDGSLHMVVPPERVKEIITSGWGEPHPVALAGLIPINTVMVFGPRDDAELEVTWTLLQASHGYAIACSIG